MLSLEHFVDEVSEKPVFRSYETILIEQNNRCSAYYVLNHEIVPINSFALHYEKFVDGTVKCIEDEIPFEVPEGWAWSRLNSLCSLIADIDHKMPKSVDNGVLFLSAKDLLNDGTINFTDDIKMISEEDFSRLSRKALPQKNDIIYSRIGACLGKARVVTKDIRFIVSYSCCTIRPVIIDSTFLASILDGDFVLAQAKESTQSVGVPDLGMTNIKQFIIPVPPIEEQKRIDVQLQNALTIVQRIANERDNLSSIITQTKSKILDLAIRGKLVPQDANDEPASVLLDRIRAEKEELIKTGRIKRDKKESVIFKGDDKNYYQQHGKTLKNINNEIPFDLPENWSFTRLRTLWDLISGRDLSSSEYNSDGIGVPYVTGASNFVNGNIEIVRWTDKPQVLTQKGDLLFTCKGTVGEMAFNDIGTAHIARQVMAIRNVYGLNSEYLEICLKFYINHIKSTAKGIIPGISREDILDLVLPVPPESYQRQVVMRVKKINSMLSLIETSLT